jgi:6-phosphogluconolactonase
MAALAARGDLPWDRIQWFWGDERCVPPDDPRSNLRLARDTLLVPRGIAAARIHPPPLELGEPAAIATAYAATVASHVPGDPAPVFDVVFLGVGTNGHVASLMPRSDALESTAPVAPVPLAQVTEEPLVARITVTPTVLRAARRVIVAVTGPEKAAIAADVMRAPAEPARLPAQLVRPSETVTWLIDRAAAGELLREAQPA